MSEILISLLHHIDLVYDRTVEYENKKLAQIKVVKDDLGEVNRMLQEQFSTENSKTEESNPK